MAESSKWVTKPAVLNKEITAERFHQWLVVEC